MIYMENVYKKLEDNYMGACLYLRVICHFGGQCSVIGKRRNKVK